ncbi:MAG: arginase family protein [Bacteroidota bacterium]|jgi:arginase family enzyme|nr:arginase family protein [Chitinophagaceae bacterium]MCE2757794.1 arginase family protein [Chitinophagaceae bacterium]
MAFESIIDFLYPVNLPHILEDNELKEGQIGKSIDIFQNIFPDLTHADIVIATCDELRGDGQLGSASAETDAVRKELYSLYYWHKHIKLADIGKIKTGMHLSDTYAAIKTVAKEIIQRNKIFLLIGGSHDLSLAVYEAYREMNKIIEVTGVDAYIDLSMDNPVRSKNFLMELLTGDPNFIRHYNHIGFQSYYIHPHMLETMDKLRFDCYRLGKVKEQMEEMEPSFRSSDMMMFDVAALGAATFWEGSSPNGFNGEEACTLMKFAGMSDRLKAVGIYGYQQKRDPQLTLAKQISQMIWYYIDGVQYGRTEANLNEQEMFIECHLEFAAIETTFLKSRKTGRWWMKMPDGKYVPCSENDFNAAGNNELPERWLRLQERS